MSILERVQEIITNKCSASTQIVPENSDMLTELDKVALTRCKNAMQRFGMIDNLRDINEAILKSKGELSEDSYIEVEEDRVAVANSTLLWRAEDTEKFSKIDVTITKRVENNQAFNLVIRLSTGLQFSTSIDDPAADQLSRDGDIGRWDIRTSEDWNNELGFYVTPDDLRKGVEERLAKAFAQVITKPGT